MNLDSIVYDILNALVPAINNIDGECSVCIKQFIIDANQELERLSVRYRYNFNREKREDRPPIERVEVIKV